jgi:hypothetical protein
MPAPAGSGRALRSVDRAHASSVVAGGLILSGTWHPRRVGGRGVGAQRVCQTPIRALELVATDRLGQRPVGVAVAAGARADHDRRLRLEVGQGRNGVLPPSQSAHSTSARSTASRPRPRRAAHVDVGPPAEHNRARRAITGSSPPRQSLGVEIDRGLG